MTKEVKKAKGLMKAKVEKTVIKNMADNCMIARTRVISRVLTNVYDDAFQLFGINSPQFALMVAISQISPASRSEVGRFTHQDRSTLTRNIKLLLNDGWIEEIETEEGGRSRPIGLTKAGIELLNKLEPAWKEAQIKAKNILGKEGTEIVKEIANDIMGYKS